MPLSNFDKVREVVSSWPAATLRDSAAAVAQEFSEMAGAINRAVTENTKRGDGFRLLYIHDVLTAWAERIRGSINRAPKVIRTDTELIEITRPGEPVLKANKKITKEI